MQAKLDPRPAEKPTGKLDDALRKRRERGRRSQAGFRQRQAEANKAIRDQNARLKTAIEKLLSTTLDDDRPEVLEAISGVADAAGISTTAEPAKTTQPIEIFSKHAKEDSSRRCSSRDDDDDGEFLNIDYSTRDFAAKPSDAAPFRPHLSIHSSSPPARLNCGIWVDHLHYMKVSLPPEDIIPYLGARANTFAGILFWSLMDHSQNKCPRGHNDPRAVIRRGLSHSSITQSWTMQFVFAMIEARLEYRTTGSISSKYASAADADLPAVICDQIKREYQRRGADPDRWLSSVGIEDRVRGMVGDDSFAMLEEAARGGGDDRLRYELQSVICKLHEHCICFGDGPRWHVDFIDRLFMDLICAVFRFASQGG